MKKLRLISMLVFVPIVLGLGLLIGGGAAGNETAIYIGEMVVSIGIPATMFVLVVVGLVLLITGKLDLSDDKSRAKDTQSEEQDEPSEKRDEQTDREKEYTQLAEINSSRGYRNRDKRAEYMARHTSNAYKNSTTKSKVLGWMFFGFLMTDFAMIMVFAFLRIFVGAIVYFCLFGGTILISLFVTVIRQKLSMSGVRRHKNSEVFDGVVKLCTLSSTTSTGGRTQRINKVVYMVTIISDETEYTAYTQDFYEPGDKIKFWKIGKRLATIIDEDKLEQLAELQDDYEPLD